MSVNSHFQKLAWCMSVVLVLSLLTTLFSDSANAAVPKLDKIRVALFIQTRDTAPAVTLSISDEAQIGIRTPQGVRNWISVRSGESARFSVDQYRILLTESGDLNSAKSAAAQVNGVLNSRERAYVLGTERNGSKVYQVVVGTYANLQEASTARDRLAGHATVSALINGFPMQIKGPNHLTAGSFAVKEEAAAIRDLYRAHGIDASLTYLEDEDDELAYAVWIGEEASADKLNDLKAKAESAVPDFALQTVDRNLPYLYERTDYTDEAPISHYYFNENGQKVWYTSGTPGIKVHERYGRTYRGSMEITQYNGRLALINELPFEQYLYAVVSNEMGGRFPQEALKAQAVAARTFALQQGMKYGIAHISDTTYDQAYYGYGSESSAAVRAVDETASEVVVNKSDSSLITPFYSSNAGGFTSETDEVWGTHVPYLHSMPSPDDIAAEGRYTWYRVVTPGGLIGYIRQDLVTSTGITTEAGLSILDVLDDNVNVRPGPDTSGAPVTQVNKGDRLIAVETVTESNPFSWITPMWKADDLLNRMNQYVRTPVSGKLNSLEVTERGMSGRAIEVVANGNQKLDVSYPDAFRSVFNGLRSTRFDIDQTNDLTILGANGKASNVMDSQGSLYVLSADNADSPASLQSSHLLAMNHEREIRVGTVDPQFRFIGRGFGHGLGMSQYGAMALADTGYDYKQILQYYYKDVLVIKG